MRPILIILIIFLASNANGEMREMRLKTLLSICETAQSNNDLGTIKNIANQIKDEPLHSDEILSVKMKSCLVAAFGSYDGKVSAKGLVQSIAEKMLAVENDCKLLLKTAPNVALENQICRTIFLSEN
jgi:hypothetical protein